LALGQVLGVPGATQVVGDLKMDAARVGVWSCIGSPLISSAGPK
jgi:hypothetical protein